MDSEPWTQVSAGATTLTLAPALHTVYEIGGDFEALVFNPDTGQQDVTIEATDQGDIEGRFGLALRAEHYLTDALTAMLGVAYRRFDVDGLDPIRDPLVEIQIDTIDLLQYYAGLRYAFPPFGSSRRWRPFLQANVAYLPAVDVGYSVRFSEILGLSDLEVEGEGDGFWTAGLAGGVQYHWRPRWLLEFGAVHEWTLADMDADLSFEVATSTIPFEAELESEGFVFFWGLTFVL